jgi:uncharacterized membrane protein YgcG
MKNNSTKLWEEYIEYAVLAFAILVMGWFAWGAFGTSIEVKVGKRTVTTATVDAELESLAKKISPKQSNTVAAPIEIVAPSPPLGEEFNRRAIESVSPNQHLVFPSLDMTASLNKGQEVFAELVMYATPEISSPVDVRTRQWFGTIRESEIDNNEDLLDEVDGPPYDTTWIQVDATFNIDAAVEAFRASSDGLQSVPDRWYDGGADIFDIQIERQRLVQGIWSDSAVIGILPGHLQYRERAENGSIDSSEKDKIIHDLRGGLQAEITRPAFYLCKNNLPSEEDFDPATWDDTVKDMTEKGMLQKKLDIQVKKITKQEKLIETIRKRLSDENGSSGGGGSMGGGGPMGGGGGGGRSGGNNKRARLQKQLNSAEAKLTTLRLKKQELEEEIDAIGSSDEGEEEVVLSGEIRVWGHDMTTTPGETYRYRMSVQLANPFFGHKPSLYPEQKVLAEKVTITSLTSEWSEEIEVLNSIQWFVVNARKSGESMNPDALDSGFVTVEFFEFSNGVWGQNTFNVQVGQRIGIVGEDDKSVDWFVLDIIEDIQGDIVLLQDIQTGEMKTVYPSVESKKTELHRLRQQVRQQVDESEEEVPDEPVQPPAGGPGGPVGSGGGGSML